VAADAIRETGSKDVGRHQLQAIPGVIRGAGLKGVRELAEKQKEKNSRMENKAFWTCIDGLLSKSSGNRNSLFLSIKTMLLERGFIQDEEAAVEKKEQKQLRKRNNDLVEIVMEQILDVYFEHFNCHYFHQSGQGGAS
jgi:hypothetical protein